MGELNQVQWVFAEISVSEIEQVRANGQVFNYRDWPLQERFSGLTIPSADNAISGSIVERNEKS